MFRQIGILLMLTGLGATACGDDGTAAPIARPDPGAESPQTTEPPSPPPTSVETTSPTSGTDPPNEAGFGEPAQYPGEFLASPAFALTGTVRVLDNGCFMLDFDNEQRVVAFPEGFVTDPTDPATVVATDGSKIFDGASIDATGRSLPVDLMTGGRDSRWGNELDYCDPGATDLIVLDTATLAFDPTSLTTDDLVGLVTDSEFTEPWPCGYGFATSTADQHVGLTIYALAEPSGPGTVTLPDTAWSAQVTVGTNLFSQNCDDVIEFWEPEAVVAASWPMTAGTFTLDIPAGPTTGCGMSRVTTTLIGAIVDTPSGPIPLDDLELTNAAWGCFAG